MTGIHLQREPREVVVDHGDGTVSLLMDAKFLDVVDGILRTRVAGDVFRAKTLAQRTTTSVLPRCDGQAAECDGGLHSGSGAILGAMGFGS